MPTAIIGSGMMGTAIAAAHLRCGLPVVLYDSSPSSLHRAKTILGENALLTFSEDFDALSDCSILLETITEKVKAKQKLYRSIVKIWTGQNKPCPLLFTNTSTISITRLAEELPSSWRQNFCGVHFFHPVKDNPVVEIIAGKETSSKTTESALQYALRLEKQPIQVGDGPGFLVNRILNGYLSAALQLLEAGNDMKRIEFLAEEFGMRMGPFRIMDEIGLDIVLHSGWVLHKAFPDRVLPSSILVRMVEQGKLGVKTGGGFLKEFEQQPQRTPLDDEKIIRRLFEPMYAEALRCVEDGIITDISVADFVSVNALGFPADKGGIIQYGKQNV